MPGFPPPGLCGRPVAALVPDSPQVSIEEVLYRVTGGTNLLAFDLDFTTSSGDPMTVSGSTSTGLADHGAAVLTFRAGHPPPPPPPPPAPPPSARGGSPRAGGGRGRGAPAAPPRASTRRASRAAS